MIKGHAKIELKDEVTGEIKTVEQDNMVTNALAELAKPFGQLNGITSHLCNSSPYSVVETLFGGVMLFEEPLNSDPDDYIWPFTNPCTGFASNIAYSGVNLKMGGYNSAESGLQEDGSYKHVWDFATDSGNGTISSLGLTSCYSARIGLGSLMHSFGVSFVHNIFSSNNSANLVFNASEYEIFRALFIKDGFLYYVPTRTFTGASNVYNNGGIFTIKKTRVPVGYVWLTTAYNEITSETIEIQLPSDFTSQFTSTAASDNSMSVEYKDGIITLAYIAHAGDLAAGGTRKLCHIDCNDNFSMTTTTFTNTTGYAITRAQAINYQYFKAMHDYCYVKTSSPNRLFIINTNDCTDIKIAQLPNGEVFVPTYLNGTTVTNAYMLGTLYTDNNITVIAFGSNAGQNSVQFVAYVDPKSGIATYGHFMTTGYYGAGYVATDEKSILGIMQRTSSSTEISWSINPFFLTTKNNLSEPVTKTATQSMKITYTLREG